MNCCKCSQSVFQYNELSGYNDLDKSYVGILAQEIETILPGTIDILDDSKGETGLSDLRLFDASELTFTLINAVKELKTESDALKASNEELKEANDALKETTDALKASNEAFKAALEALTARLEALEQEKNAEQEKEAGQREQ